MKKIILLLSFICCLYTTAQTTISVSGVTAGGLSTAITAVGGDLNTVSNLTVSGTIDSRDFLVMRDNMPVLAVIDLNATTIDAYNSDPANAIPAQAFFNANIGVAKTSLTSFIFPSSITSIQLWGFTQCTGLTILNIPNSVTFIDEQSFMNCTGLTSVSLPTSITSIGTLTFSGCTNLASLMIPSSVTSIGESAFLNCTSLTALTLPASLTLINMTAFQGCTGLTSIAIPNSVTTIGNRAFYNCSGLISVSMPSVVTIGNEAFVSCSGLTSVTIPNTVTTIGNNAFNSCTGLTTIYANSIVPVNLSSSLNVFQGVDVNTCILNVPSGSLAAYSTANQWQDFTNINPFLGANDFELDTTLTAYPNPSNGVFNINSDTRGTTVVYDLIGKIIKTETIILGSSKLDLSNYPSGMYLMKVTNDNNQTKTMKLIKE